MKFPRRVGRLDLLDVGPVLPAGCSTLDGLSVSPPDLGALAPSSAREGGRAPGRRRRARAPAARRARRRGRPGSGAGRTRNYCTSPSRGGRHKRSGGGRRRAPGPGVEAAGVEVEGPRQGVEEPAERPGAERDRPLVTRDLNVYVSTALKFRRRFCPLGLPERTTLEDAGWLPPPYYIGGGGKPSHFPVRRNSPRNGVGTLSEHSDS